MAKGQFPHKILWLASYPKSGNTWFRAFLSALLTNKEVEINNMITDGILAGREVFEQISDIDSRYLYHDEAKWMLADVYRTVAQYHDQLSIIKVHDAFAYDKDGTPFLPPDVTHKAIYFVRNPLDIVGSLAHHMHMSIDQAVRFINNKSACLAPQQNNFNKSNQLRQELGDWTSHVKSWMTVDSFPIHVVRYEDMINSPVDTFVKATEFIGWQYQIDQIERAINAVGFNKLKAQEEQQGFAEFTRKGGAFFRSGKIGNWTNELDAAQIFSIVEAHGMCMGEFGYDFPKK